MSHAKQNGDPLRVMFQGYALRQ